MQKTAGSYFKFTNYFKAGGLKDLFYFTHMSRFHSYLNSAQLILEMYKGEEPFASFLKKFFASNKKYGSKDRKQVSHLCYCYFRMGKMALNMPVAERILAGLFLCSGSANEMLEELKPGWNEKVTMTAEEKCIFLDDDCSLFRVFPWKDELSDGIELEGFCASFFKQPDVFVRLRHGYESRVREKLAKAGLPFRDISQNCIAIESGTKIDNVLALDYEAMIQDLNSQRTGELMWQAVKYIPVPFISAWDCCAGSGGKSIMLFDIHQQMNLTVSDVRETIIRNLKKRFAEHGIKNYQVVMADISKGPPPFSAASKFNLIIADVPCTGSGTWSRTPEQLYYFDHQAIAPYSYHQRKIVSNIIPHLGPGGYLLYITCSVFKRENEDNITFMQQQYQLDLVRMELLKGYNKKADTMFAALLQKPL